MEPDLGEELGTNEEEPTTNEDIGTRGEINSISTELIGLSAYYSHEWQVLICNICKTSVNGEFIENHYKSNHKTLKKKERDQFIERIAVLGLVIATRDSVRTPKPLEIYSDQLRLWGDYLACDKCNDVVAKNEKYMDVHYNRVHRIKFPPGRNSKRARPYWTGLQVQSFFNKPEKWFIANTPHNKAILQPNTAEFTEIEPNDQLNALINEKNAYYQRLEAENERLTNDLFGDSDPKHIHQFLIRFHWRFWLRGKSIAKLTELGVTPTENDPSGEFLLKLSRIGWKKVENLLVEPPSRFILQIVNTQRFKDKGSEYEQRPFNALQKIATKDRYSLYWAEFILISYRIWTTEAFNIKFTSEIIECLERIDEFGNQHNWTVDESDDDEFINSNIDKFNELTTQLLIHSITQDITQSTSLTNQNDTNDKSFTNPIILWCIIKSFNDVTGAFRSDSDISNIFSAMIWNVKLFTVKYALIMDVEANEGVSSDDELPNEEMGPKSRFHLHQFIQKFHSDWLTVDKFTVYQTIQQYRAYSRKMRQDAREGVIEDVDHDLIRYNGNDVRISDLKSLIHSLTRRCADLLYNQLLFIHPDEISKQLVIDQLYDDNYESECGWWFGKSHRNSVEKYSNFLMQRFLQINTELGSEWTRRLANGLELKPTKVDQWLRVRIEFIKELVNLLHLSGGAPIRGSEIIEITYRNSVDLMRTIFIDLNKKAVRINSRYSKTVNMTGKDRPTIRFYPKNISQLVIHYLVIALPFYHKVQIERKLSVTNEAGESEPYRISDFLIEIDGKTPKEGVIGEWIRNNFNAHLNSDLTVKDFRHSIKFIIKTRILPNEEIVLSDSDSENEDLAEDLQSGHSTFIAQNHYSRNINIPLRFTESEYTKAMRLSHQYHQFFQINTVNIHNIIVKTITQMNNANKHRRELSEIQLAKRPRANLTQQIIDNELQLAHELRTDPAFLKGKLREFLKDPHAKFRGSEQLEAIQLGLTGEPRIVYINGTGSGKSLVFFLSSYILPGKCHVIFAPLNALKENLVDRARAANLTVTIWKASSEPMVDENVVFVSYENLVQESFTDWLKKKKRINAIERIFIDEAHVIVTQSSWRYIMRYMADINLLEIPITFLTATFTREIELLLKREMKLPDSDTRLIRGSTKRKNIHYTAIRLRSKGYQIDAFKSMINRAINRLIENGRFSTNDLTLIFTRGSKGEIQQLAEGFEFEYYFSNRPNHAQILTDFKAARIRTLVTSNALSLGLDLPNIRAVFHIGKSTSLIDFSQESGRAGRDGQPAYSTVIYGENEFQPINEWFIDLDENSLNFNTLQTNDSIAMNRYVNQRTCRRRLLNRIFDNSVSERCTPNEDALCDLCNGRNEILNESATAQRKSRTNELNNTIQLESFLNELEEGCAWCVYKRQFGEWKNHEIGKCPNRVIGGGNSNEYGDFMQFTIEIGTLIRAKKLVQKGSACFGCWLPMKFCKRLGNNEKCIIRGRTGTRLVYFITFFYFVHWKLGQKSVQALVDIASMGRNGMVKEIAHLASATSVIHNTECIQAIHWVEEFDWGEWFKE